MMDRPNNFLYLRAFSKTFNEFSQNSSMNGYKYLTQGTRIERLTWLVIHACALAAVICSITYLWNTFTANPTIVTLERFTFPIEMVSFPGVSICDMNRISKKRALLVAKAIEARSGRKIDDIMKNIILLGKLYDFSITASDDDRLLQFQKFLDENYSNEDGVFDTNVTMELLTTSCTEMLANCKWNGIGRNCEDLFVRELTMDGYCCVFNYCSENNTTIISKALHENGNASLYSERSGKAHGLTFRVYTNISDYMYTIMATTGTNVLFSSSHDYPDITSGSLIQRIVPVGVEANLRLSGKVMYTVDEARKYAADKRKCIFRDEQSTLFGSYSHSDCIMDCKIKSILALCQCINFMHVKVSNENSYPQCNLADLVCLDKYSTKWKILYPYDYEGNDLDREKQDALACNTCLPECGDTIYYVNNEFSKLARSGLNYSIINIFFENPYVELHKQDVLFYWYDMTSMFGGICSLIMGISIISVVEILVFFTYRYLENIFILSRDANRTF